MKMLYFLLFLIPGFALSAAKPPKADFYVSPLGDDRWSGSISAPNEKRSDGPFATIERARKAVRQFKKKHPDSHHSILTLIRGGVYELSAILTFEPEDSGSPDAPVIYAAYPGEKPILSGGRRIGGWKKSGVGWRAELPGVKSGDWNFIQLFVNGDRRYRPRFPKDTYYRIAGALPPSDKSKEAGFDRFKFYPGDLRANWSHPEDAEILAFNIWSMSRFPIESIDEEKRIISFTGHTPGTSSWAALPQGNRYIIENVKEALSRPGEWYLDRKSGVLTYLPMPGEKRESAEIVAPRLARLAEFKGDVAKHLWVHDLRFEGLIFAYANYVTPKEGHSFPQAEIDLHGAITATGLRNAVFENCAVAHVGEYAIELGSGCRNNRISGCELIDLGAGGVKLGEQGISPDEEANASHQAVVGNLIAHGGRLHPAGIGVWLGQTANNDVSHNEIYDFYYTGISAGWTWGYGPSLTNHNHFSYNHIHQIGQGVLSDMGGTYTLGISPGSVQDHNLIHDVYSYSYGGWGIYFDEGTSGMLAEDNVVYRMSAAGFHQHYGENNRVLNNIFAFGKEAEVMRTRAEDHLSFTFDRNLVYWTEGPLLGSNWSGDNYKLDDNLYWNAAKQPVTFAGMSPEDWRKKGQDLHSILENPLFANPDKGDFSLKQGSPAFKIGFKPIDLKSVGPARSDWPLPDRNRSRAFPPPPPPLPPQPISEDFEDLNPGDKATLPNVQEENDVATIRVTDETASSGRNSLKFTDAPGQRANYDPHLFYEPGFKSGLMSGSFDLRLEPNAVFFHEWRDNSNPYKAGPSLRIGEDGILKAGNESLMEIPRGEWMRFSIECGLGNQAKGAYSLTVQPLKGGETRVFHSLPCDPAFKSLHWYGFVSDGTESSAFYLDNIQLSSLKKKA